ncbi:hypothetical protein KW491_06170 [Vibrio fluvialis]|nr:hypothetical protein [Vibrio fluvialis]MBY8132154.1 hypothetical protein [Vibrio fluvialis]
MLFYEKQISHFTNRYSHLNTPPTLELIHLGKQADSEYAIFLEKHPHLGNEVLFSYPSMLEPLGYSYWNKRMTKSGWPAEIRAFPKKKIKEFEKKLKLVGNDQ